MINNVQETQLPWYFVRRFFFGTPQHLPVFGKNNKKHGETKDRCMPVILYICPASRRLVMPPAMALAWSLNERRLPVVLRALV
jgi:hypothetical protein